MAVAVRAATITALKHQMPGQIGPGRRWEEPFLNLLIDAVDAEVREYCELSYAEQVITPSNGVYEYELDDDCISIYRITWASDGTTYDNILDAVSFEDLDNRSRLWRNDTGGEPYRYVVTSTPGVPTVPAVAGTTESTIIIHPKVSAVGSAKMKVRYVCTGGTTGSSSQFAVDKVYVPYVRALLSAPSSDQKQSMISQGFYADYLRNREDLRGSVSDEYDESLS